MGFPHISMRFLCDQRLVHFCLQKKETSHKDSRGWLEQHLIKKPRVWSSPVVAIQTYFTFELPNRRTPREEIASAANIGNYFKGLVVYKIGHLVS